MAKEPQIEVRYACERCDGSGHILNDPAAVGREPIRDTHACPDCNGTGEARRMWIGISWLRDELQ
jgi:DnaJ-class molecular chaperone